MHKYPLGLALSGGAIKGFAHIGVLRALEEYGLRPDILAGTSAGALVAAFYSDGYRPNEIFELFSKMSLRGMTSIAPLVGGGLLDTRKFTEFLSEHLRHQYLEELPIPLRIVATNLDAGSQHVFQKGNLAQIVTASCSIPILFHPMIIDGTSYVDGGLYRNFPVTIIRKQASFIIGVNLGPEAERTDEKNTLIGVGQRAWQLIFRQNTRPDKHACDLLLETYKIQQYGMFDISVARDIMEIGYQLAIERIGNPE